MVLQFADTFDNPSESTARVYIPAEIVTDSAFPFGPGDSYVLRVARHEGFAVTPPDSDRETIDLPPINEEIL
ncbi:hypothetical protein [Natrialba asiatica]|uniref:Uncharacterized protein n=1 Tax=Natrialba asiatica (strain ATCC 700177 / DSM 12278 / JCM 9576 / FERM P-10747 / NBRC 102637 / 172P1) TaxID=29540 RepID=M0AGY4_NATA1|nr:hypothetical protein [Natrialba asiatica]ELY97157.1 hypothetical protein C481_21251 [Natrialba asiatica DSM 12278]